MANLTISRVCNMACPYCFAQGYMRPAGNGRSSAFMPLETFRHLLDFLARSGINQVRLIGGEPTLHPHFVEMVSLAQAHGLPLLIFSHGLMPERALACLENLPLDVCQVLINTNATQYPNGPTPEEMSHRQETMRRLGRRAQAGFTIFRPDFDPTFLLPLIATCNCRPAIRLGLAQPIADGTNAYLHPKQYPFVGHRIAQFAKQAAARGVRLEFDCGFVPCMFSPADMAILQEARADVGWRCNPILDIDGSNRAIHCFALSGKADILLDTKQDAAELRHQLIVQTQPYRGAGIYRDCSTCPLKQQGDCPGGCLAFTMRRFQHMPFRLTVPDSIIAGQF